MKRKLQDMPAKKRQSKRQCTFCLRNNCSDHNIFDERFHDKETDADEN